MRKNCSSDEEKLAQIIQISERLIFETECSFNLFLEVHQIQYIGIISIQIGKNVWDLEIYRKG